LKGNENMKAYGVKRSDTCGSNNCSDDSCIGNKYRRIRGKSKHHRKNAFKVPKSSFRFKNKVEM